MNKKLYCETIDQIKLSDDSIDIIMHKLTNHSIINNNVNKYNNRKFKYGFVTILFALIIFSYVFLSNIHENENIEKGIYLEKIKLPESDNLMESDLTELIVYNGKIYKRYYILKMNDINLENKKGDYLGTTKNSINEWPSERDYTKELSSTIGEQDVFSVNGYDTDFRIMTYNLYKGVVFYDCMNDIWIYDGEDLFSKMKMKDNVKSVKYLTFNNWNNGIYNFKNLDISNELINYFINELYNTKYEKYHDKSLEHAPIYFTLFDGSIIELILYEDGFVEYPGVSGVYGYAAFKMDKEAFDSIYTKLLKD